MLSAPLLKIYKVLLTTTNLHAEFLFILKKHLIITYYQVNSGIMEYEVLQMIGLILTWVTDPNLFQLMNLILIISL